MNKIHMGILYIIIILLSTKGFSQNNKVKLLEIMPTNNRLGKLNIKSISLDNRLASNYIIGFINSKTSNTSTQIVPPNQTISEYVLGYLNSALVGHFNSNGQNIKIILNEFSAGQDFSSDGNRSFVKLNADIFKVPQVGDSTFLGTYDSTIVSLNDNLVHSHNISDLLIGLVEYSNSLLSGAQSGSKIVKGQFEMKNGHLDRQNKITKATIYPTGIYTSYQQFLDNAPAITSFRVSYDAKTDSVAFFKIDSKDSSGKLIDNIWGLASGNELYKFFKGSIVPIEKLDNGFFLSKYVDSKQRKNRANFWRNNIGSKADILNPFDNKYNVKVQSKNGVKFQATHIDIGTGNLTF